MKSKIIYVVWYPHARRAETLANELHGQVYFIYETSLRRGFLLKPLRYLAQAWKTWRLLEQERPNAVIVQSPPIFAALAVALWCKWHEKVKHEQRVRYAIDCHTGTFYDPNWSWTLPLLRLLSRRATVTLCSTMRAEDILRSWQVEGFFLDDGNPALSLPSGTVGMEGQARVGIIGSLDSDEPVAETFAAARLLPHVTFYMVGNPSKLKTNLLAQKPENVILTGFLHDGLYTALLHNVHGLVILTKRQSAINCAVYEAVALAKPAVLSYESDNRDYFTRGFIYVQNTPEAIAAGVQQMLAEQEKIIPEIVALRSELATKRQPKVEKLTALLTRNVEERC